MGLIVVAVVREGVADVADQVEIPVLLVGLAPPLPIGLRNTNAEAKQPACPNPERSSMMEIVTWTTCGPSEVLTCVGVTSIPNNTGGVVSSWPDAPPGESFFRGSRDHREGNEVIERVLRAAAEVTRVAGEHRPAS